MHPIELFNLEQRENEILRQWNDRFSEEVGEIDAPTPQEKIAAR